MKSSELRAKTTEELAAELVATQKELFSLRLQKKAGGTNANVSRAYVFKQVRHKIARIKTILNEKTRENNG